MRRHHLAFESSFVFVHIQCYQQHGVESLQLFARPRGQGWGRGAGEGEGEGEGKGNNNNEHDHDHDNDDNGNDSNNFIIVVASSCF